MTKRTAPYKHVDSSPCWTKNCSKGNSILNNLKSHLTVGGSTMTFAELDKAIKDKNDVKAERINAAMRNHDFAELLPSIEAKQFHADKNVLFQTIHGSHLYGLNHAGSDEDYYTIVASDQRSSSNNQKTKQTIKDGIDSVQVSLNHFMLLAQNGSHQALEAMFSQKITGDPIESMRKNYYVGSNIFVVYERTIRNFALAEDFKRRRHALRLIVNLNEMTHTGRFNPTLTQEQAKTITEKTNGTFDEYFNYVNELSEIEIQWENNNRAHTVRR